MRFFAVGFAVFGLIAAAAISGRATAPGAKHDSPQMRDAVALVTTNIASAVSYYDLQWNDPPHIISVRTLTRDTVFGRGRARARAFAGDSVVVEEVKMSVDTYSSLTPDHVRFVVRGIVSPKDWLRSIRVVSQQKLKAPKAKPA